MDIIEQLGPLALASRLKRLSDRLMRDVARLYKEQKLEFQPRWFPVSYLLMQHKSLPVTTAAAALGMSHPAINQIAAQMTRHGLLASSHDKNDDRKRLLALTPKGRKTFNDLKKILESIDKANRELLSKAAPDFLANLDRIEKELAHFDMYRRVNVALKGETPVRIIPFKPSLKGYFRELNQAWLKEYFSVEPVDEAILSDPVGQVIDNGGAILFAQAGQKIVGVVALLKHDHATFEITKMAVAEEFQNNGIGLQLGQSAIETARGCGANEVFLKTSPRLKAALRLYKKLGFVRDQNGTYKSRFKRKSITMRLKLNKS